MSVSEASLVQGATAATLAWCQAMATGDVTHLAKVTHPDFVDRCGPDGRSLNRTEFLVTAKEFVTEATIDTWSIADLTVRIVGPAAVCSYSWAEAGSYRGQSFQLRGVATDVLMPTHDGRGWAFHARHVNLTQHYRDEYPMLA